MKYYFILRAWRGEESLTEQFLSLEDAMGYARKLEGDGYRIDLYKARKII